MQRRYPRTTEDREAIAAARRRHYARQAAHSAIREQEDEAAKTPSPTPTETIPTQPSSNKGEVSNTGRSSGEGADTQSDSNTTDQNAADELAKARAAIVIPDNFEKLEWKPMRALAEIFANEKVINKPQALKAIGDEIARRAAGQK